MKKVLTLLVVLGLATLAGWQASWGQQVESPAGRGASSLDAYTLVVYDARAQNKITFGQLIDQLSAVDLVCVGERHDSELHHRVQLRIIQALFALNDRLGVGMEMFQRPFQDAIDDYFQGKTHEEDFLKASEYKKRWGFSWDLYRPIVEFSRKNGIPLAALNAPRELTSKVVKGGLASLSEEDRRQLGDIDFHVKEHREHWYEKLPLLHGRKNASVEEKDRSYQVMTIWDDFMASSAAQFQKTRNLRQLVILAGAGHIERSFGIPARAARKTGGKFATVRVEVALDHAKVSADPAAHFVINLQTPAGQLPPLPIAVSSFGAAVADGWVYAYGGHQTKTHDYSTEAVAGAFHRLKLADPRGWEKLPAHEPAQGLAVVAHKGKIYRVGGMQPRNKPGEKHDNHSLASASFFDPGAGKWLPFSSLPAPRSSHDAVVAGDKLIVVGGWQQKGAGTEAAWHTTTLVRDLKKFHSKWESVPQPFKRRALTAAVLAGKVYVLGGMNEEEKIELTVNIFDPAKNEWSLGPNLPGPRRNGFSPAACEAGGKLFVSTGDGKVWQLSPKGDAWDEIATLKQQRIVHRIVPTGRQSLLILGGAFGGDNIALTEEVTLQNK